MRFKGVLDKLYSLDHHKQSLDGSPRPERILYYTGRRNYDEDALRLYDEAYMARLYHICRENVVGKVVNVGTVGHIDHGSRGYVPNMADISWSTPHVKSYYNPFKPEFINCFNGLLYVAGRVVHDMDLYAENPSGQPALVDYPGILYEEPPQFMLDGKGGVRGIGNIIGKSSLVLDKFIEQSKPGYMTATDKVYRRERNKERLVADRKSIVPSRRAIQWAIEMRNWKDKDLFKLLGMKQFSPEQLAALRWERKDG